MGGRADFNTHFSQLKPLWQTILREIYNLKIMDCLMDSYALQLNHHYWPIFMGYQTEVGLEEKCEGVALLITSKRIFFVTAFLADA